MNKKIQLRIFPDGTIQAEVQGIKGKRCTDYIKILEEILEAKTVDSDYTPEYYQSDDLKIITKENQRIKRK
jgi:hypothetical protein